jgi:hypothetical protein
LGGQEKSSPAEQNRELGRPLESKFFREYFHNVSWFVLELFSPRDYMAKEPSLPNGS